jgi:arylsulfatase A-like enzyme
LPTPRTEPIVRADIAAYYAVISHMDMQIGRILDALDAAGKSDSTIIVFCSDHGLAMGSHGLRGKQNMYEHTIVVPLIFAGPGIPAGKKFTGLAYLRDIFPTICELAGVEVPETEGKSQVPVLRGAQSSMYEFVVGYFRDSQRMIRTNRWKLIQYPLAQKTQLFNLEVDPFERNDLSSQPEQTPVLDRLSRKLQAWMAAHKIQ